MRLQDFDLPIQRFLSGFAQHYDLFDRLTYALGYYDIFQGVVMMSLLWMAWVYQKEGEDPEEQDKRHAHLLVVFAGCVATVLLSRILQLALNVHQRPILDASLGLKFPKLMDPATVNTWNSFPSDHSMLFFALAVGLWQVNRWIGGFAFFWATFMIDLPRIYLGYHYPSDVIAGSLLGILCMLGFEKLPVDIPANRVVAYSKLYPAAFLCCAFLATDQVAHLFDDLRELGHLFLAHFKGH